MGNESAALQLSPLQRFLILMSVTLIAGIYGMNFERMPELGWKYGYVFALSWMVVVGFGLYIFFKKRKWL